MLFQKVDWLSNCKYKLVKYDITSTSLGFSFMSFAPCTAQKVFILQGLSFPGTASCHVSKFKS